MMDFVLELWVGEIIERARLGWMLGAGRPWQPDEKLKLLFAGYNGTRNTGSDLRVHEMLRQVRQVLGAERLELSVMTQNFEASRGYFGDARQVRLPDIFPPFLRREVPRHHGVVACEGSMFKSKFANALTTMMIGSLGIAAAQNKLSVGYGGDAGEMDPMLQKMVRRFCRRSLVIPRSEESQALLSELGVPTELGTDTAWTFEPLGPEYGRKVLTDAGWDGRKPVLAVCPINPFWWPVKPSVPKFLARMLFGAYKESHYRTIYFHQSGAEVDRAYKRYLDELAIAVNAFRSRHDVFTILVAMESLDARACHAIAPQVPAPILTSDQYDMFQLVSIVRCARWMVSSRYHGIVSSMPAGVVSAGVTMDERIRNMMRERGHNHLLVTVNDPKLHEKLIEAMETLVRDEDSIRDAIYTTVVRNLKVMARMGVFLEKQVHARYPEFPVRTGVHHWEAYLPPLSAELRALIESQESAASAAAARTNAATSTR
ncbi:MAG: polysaccharide pyruvyl transferase family protein [Candidatus Acidiferrales bacterium]|jgi:polysaccharide pyruvyl transferase WcaK-like protein